MFSRALKEIFLFKLAYFGEAFHGIKLVYYFHILFLIELKLSEFRILGIFFNLFLKERLLIRMRGTSNKIKLAFDGRVVNLKNVEIHLLVQLSGHVF
jgi:hypothetical protein